MVAALLSPLAGAVACFEAYLLNPSTISMYDFGFRYQFWITFAFIAGFIIHRPQGALRVGREGTILIALWIYVAIAALTAAWAVIDSAQALNGVYEISKPLSS